MNENDELEIELENPNEGIDINEENYVYINIPEGVIDELEAEIALRALITEAGAQIALEINNSTYVLTAKLKDKNGNVIYTSNGIDLPIESMIINGEYDEETKKLILTLQNGQTIEISLADLISGLVSETRLVEVLQDYYTKTQVYNKTETDAMFAEEESEISKTNDRVDRLYNSLPKNNVSGESVDITDSADLPLAEFGLKGKSEQDGTPTPENPIAINSVGDNVNLFDKNTTNIINGQIRSSGAIEDHENGAKTCFISVKPNTTYTIQKVISSVFYIGTTATTPQVGMTVSQFGNYTSNKNASITTSSTSNYLCIFYYYPTSDILTEQQILNSIKIEEDSTASPYSPYGMGCASIEKSNKNLLDISANNVSLSSAGQGNPTVTFNDDGFTATGYGGGIWFYVPYQSGQTHMLSLKHNGAFTNIRTYKKNKTTQLQNIATILSSGSHTAQITSTDEDGYYIRFWVEANSNAKLDYAMIENSTTATTYIAHQGKTYIIPTQQPMRSIGDVKDDFVLQNGEWYERHKIFRKVFDGTENWSLTDSVYYLKAITDYKISYGNICLCTHYLSMPNVGNTSAVEDKKCCFFISHAAFRFYIKDTSITSLEDFKSYLAEQYASGTPVYVDYILEEPTLIACTNEQSAVLNQILEDGTYQGITHYYSNDTVKATINLTYYQDWTTRLDNIEARLDLLE